MHPERGIPAHDRDGLVRALHASDARFREMIEKNVDGILVVRHDGLIRFANPAACELLGRRLDDLLGHDFGVPILPGERTEIDLLASDGAVRIAEMRVVETEWDGERAFLASLRDLTERKRLEEQFRQKADALAEADRRKDEFLAMLAHELRNPLAPILNAVHVMRLRGDDLPTLERMRDLVEQQVRHLARLVDDLLDVSRITRGKIELRKESMDLSSAIHRAVEVVRPVIDERGHTLALDVPRQPLILDADPTRIEQVLVNLLTNAAKYTDAGGSIRLAATAEPGGVRVRVQDNGIGIAPELLPAVFDLFTQAETTLDRSQGGLGIGLTLVRNLVQMHGGTVEARSAGLGRGSEFVIWLPTPALEESAGAEEKPSAGPESEPSPCPPLRVLIVDDNVASAESLALIVRLWGHDSRVAHTGPEALAAAQAYRPEVMLLDIGLPGMDGYQVARLVRVLPGLESLLLVAMTGYGHDEAVRRSHEAGFDRHLVKPLNLDVLERLLGDHATKTEPERC